MTGIYLITNIETNKHYVGKSVDVERRWKQHMSDLNTNSHANIDLQEDWNKYGEEKFTFKILEVCSKDIISNREKHWIDIFNAREYGYNFDNRKTSKSSWNKETKKNEKIEKLLRLCSYYSKDNTLGLFYLDDILEYLSFNKLELHNFLYKITRKDFEKFNVFAMHNWDSQEEYISFCKWDKKLKENCCQEIYYIEHINEYLQKQAS
jgi:hypothetical protein